MNRDEILALKPGTKLDLLVAFDVMHDKPGTLHPAYSRDSAAAQQVLDKLKEEWDFICLIWDAGAWDIAMEKYGGGDCFYLGDETGKTYEKLEEAICKAALIAMEKE